MAVSTSLTLRAILKAAASRLDLGVPAARVSGLSAAAKAFYVAAAAAHCELVVLVVPGDADVEQMTADARFFLATFEGLSESDAARAVLPFPSHEVDPYRGLALHFDVASTRARALHALASGRARIVIGSAGALLPRLSAPERLLAASIDLARETEVAPDRLADLLADAGFAREDPVDEHGEFCVRGGVVDFFPAGEDQPVRLEFVGDTVESLRRYDPASQRSVATLDHANVVPVRELFDDDSSVTVFDYLARGGSPIPIGLRPGLVGARHANPRAPQLLVSEPEEVASYARRLEAQVYQSYDHAAARGEAVAAPGEILASWEEIQSRLEGATALEELSIEPQVTEAGAVPARHIACQAMLEFRGRLGDWMADVRRGRALGEDVVFVAATPGRAERVVELASEYELPATLVDRADEARVVSGLLVATGQLSRGFRLPEAGLQLYAETDVFEEERRVHERRRSRARAFLSDFRDLKVGDPVVHVDHGIGVFVGLRQIVVGTDTQEFVELRYAAADRLYVPVERLEVVQKYTGAAKPTLDRLGGTTWERAKTRVRRAMRDMAEELLRLYAARKAIQGHAFAPDTHWQQEFEDAFEYELTPDQQAAIADIKRDMEAAFPMDRLLCGDVGYGKTEVAMRAAFKAVMDGKQVAFLAPTTVLAFQHLKTLCERFAAFPARIELVSRFRSRAEQKTIVAELAAGRVDIIIGTHRLLSKDVQFRDLGLLVVDEEQRFGVAHKERLKQLRRRVDVLTLTATPIPRTLNMSLVGIRDMSIIETPPKDRLAIQTHVARFDPELVAGAVRTELARSGQVYFVHNRVESIDTIGTLINRLVPEARVAIAHGQMSESALERVMIDFVGHKSDVLLATTIIENGLDIPNANTMIVDRADDYGLAQLYQLRGRVGRSDRRAYAYLLVPPDDILSPVARKRLAALKEFSDLGSGFRVAALDLEIRGAGNLLGGEQSGHIEAIGFDMYMKLLEQTVRELRGEELEDEVRAAVNLKVDLRIDVAYIPDMNQRLSVYRRVASARSDEDLQRVLEETRDRYGPMPTSIVNLGQYGSIRILADRLGVESIEREGQVLAVKFRPNARIDPARLVRIVQEWQGVRLTPPAILRLDLRAFAGGRGVGTPVTSPGASASWWTARALAGEVTGGFSKQAILKPVQDDAGILARTAEALVELSATAGIS